MHLVSSVFGCRAMEMGSQLRFHFKRTFLQVLEIRVCKLLQKDILEAAKTGA